VSSTRAHTVMMMLAAGALAGLVGVGAAHAQVALRADCPEGLPSDLAAALALELGETVVGAADDGVVVRVTTPCAQTAREIEVWIERHGDPALGPVRLEVAELGARIRGRVVALWIAEHVRIARGVPGKDVAPSAGPAVTAETVAGGAVSGAAGAPAGSGHDGEPASSLAAPALAPNEATVLGRILIRGSLAFALGHDLLAGGVGPGADLRVDLGTRGRPGLALELGLGGTGLAAGDDTWTELRASLGGLLDVMLDPRWGSTFGVRLLFVHEVYTGSPDGSASLPDYRVDDGLDIRGAAFAGGRLYVHEALSLFAELELGGLLFSFLPNGDAGARPQNGLQGVLRLGASFG